jgi:ABC-type lipoprotein release transport system permease subunit
MNLPYLSIFKIIMEGRSASRFMLGAVGSFAFSIAVILCTIGLMDGFEKTLKAGLNKAAGDMEVFKGESFFHYDEELESKLKEEKDLFHSPLIQAEAFIIGESESKGVLVKGIQPGSFKNVTGLDIPLKTGEIFVGKELYDYLLLSKDDEVTVTFATNSRKNQGAPILKDFTVAGTVAHGIYEKDLRFVYIIQEELRDVLSLKKRAFNTISVKLKNTQGVDIAQRAAQLQQKLGEYRVVPFWKEFQTLLDAVEVEKLSISMILQLIVIVAIFNVIAFIIFISEKKAQEFFLLRALGLNISSVIRFWIFTVFGMWAASCVLSVILARFFNALLLYVPFFQLPGDIYVLSHLTLQLGPEDYLLVFGAALIWMMLVTTIALLRLRKKSLIYGLRQEFS